MQAKKSLGQNFLKNKIVVEKMVKKADLKSDDLVLEIGPGKGFLTNEILKTGVRVIALEKDTELIKYLQEKFSNKSDSLEIIEGDALEINYKKLKLKNKKFLIISNLPYYITGKFLSNVLSNKIQPKKIILLLQREVVDRIIDTKKSSILSISIQAYGQTEKIMNVSKTNFSPQPKIDSSVLEISNISKDFFTKKITEKIFFDFIKLAFSNKRKKLIKNLSKKYDKKKLENIFSSLNLNPNLRAEDLKLDNFKNILKKLN